MTQRTALITGILGQDGSLLSELLLARGYRVVGVARPGARVSPDAEASSGAMLENIDLADTEGVRALLQRHRPDEIYHLAAFHHSSQDVSVSKLVEGKDAMIRTNFLTTKTLAFALAELGSSAHLVLASSSQIYTAREGLHRVDETTSREPATFYGHVKSWSMDLLAFMRRESAIRASSAILFNHESPRRGVQFVSRKITRAAALASTGAHPELHVRDVGARVDWSSARDVVQAMSLMGAAPDARDYVIASGQPHSVRDLLSVAFDKVGLDWREFTRFDADTSGPALVGSPRAIEHALGWRRAVSFEAMVGEMVENDIADHAGAAVPLH